MSRATPTHGAVPPREDGPVPHPRDLARAEPARRATRLLGPRDAAGVALCLDPQSDEFRLVLADRDGAPAASFGPFPEEEVVALWRSLGGATGLPLLVQRADGGYDAPYPRVGPLQLGAVRFRRRHGLLNGRRPRFLVRRKTGAWALRPAVHRDAEMFGHAR